MNDQVYASGEWHDRNDDWRNQIDLSTCDRETLYAAGRDDGYRQAMTEFREMWQLLVAVDSAWSSGEVREVKAAAVQARARIAGRRQRHLRVVGQ
jgi:hypothetical protein